MSGIDRPTRPALSRDYILDQALGLIDREGLESFTFRKLAREIGADPMAAYYYFHGKAALFDGIVEAVYGEIRLPEEEPAPDGPERLKDMARAIRAAFLRHPRALPLLSTRPAATKGMAPTLEKAMEAMESAGIAAPLALDSLTCIVVFVLGHALSQVGEPIGGSSEAGGAELLEAAADFPRLREAIAAMPAYDADRQFELGLKALVEGLLFPRPSR